jgi:hypothetical protein
MKSIYSLILVDVHIGIPEEHTISTAWVEVRDRQAAGTKQSSVTFLSLMSRCPATVEFLFCQIFE